MLGTDRHCGGKTLGASQSDLTSHKNDIFVITGVNNSGQKSGSAGHTCNLATFLTANDVPRGIHSIRDRVKQMLDLSVLAFSCDLTRVITFGYEHTVSEQSHPWIGVNEGYHIGVTHNQPGAPYATVNKWIVSQFAYLLDKLKAVPDGPGTLLDNTIVYFASELGEGSSHSGQDILIIVAGTGGGKIAQGRLLARPGQGNGNVLISLMQAMGVPLSKFGNGFTAPLPGLVAA